MNPYYDTAAGVTLYHGDALEVLRGITDLSVDCCVTSPPYFGLRDYGVDGQIGAEASPAEFVQRLRDVFTEVRRVLADDGTCWLNLGDSYSRSGANSNPGASSTMLKRKVTSAQSGMPGRSVDGLAPKNLLGIPWRTAFALQADGWVLRSEVIWAKRNFMPEAVTDRPTKAHEQVFMLTKSQQYWYDAEAIREELAPEQEAHNQRYAREYQVHSDRATSTGQPGNRNNVGIHSRPGPGGRNARDVWTISSNPFPGAHFAVMPSELADRCILAGCKPGGTVLDPFSGSGTTGMVALRHGLKYVGIDLNADYLDLSLRTRLHTGVLDFGDVS